MKKQVDYHKIEQNARRRSRIFKTVAYLFLGIWAVAVLFPEND